MGRGSAPPRFLLEPGQPALVIAGLDQLLLGDEQGHDRRRFGGGELAGRNRGEREFGIGYGRSSGYVRNRSYVASQPTLFRCR